MHVRKQQGQGHDGLQGVVNEDQASQRQQRQWPPDKGTGPPHLNEESDVVVVGEAGDILRSDATIKEGKSLKLLLEAIWKKAMRIKMIIHRLDFAI